MKILGDLNFLNQADDSPQTTGEQQPHAEPVPQPELVTEGEEAGALVQPVVGELVAVFEPWSPETGRSANLIDLAFDSEGSLYVACAEEGRIWKVGVPDPENVFDGVDQGPNPTSNRPYLDLADFTGNARARVGNLVFDEQDRLYVCSGNYDSGTPLAGVIYRAVLGD